MWKPGEKATLRYSEKLVFESGRSSIYNWETGSPELIKLYEIMTQTDGIYGVTLLGRGFQGVLYGIN